MNLKDKCPGCDSYRWCGRSCANPEIAKGPRTSLSQATGEWAETEAALAIEAESERQAKPYLQGRLDPEARKAYLREYQRSYRARKKKPGANESA